MYYYITIASDSNVVPQTYGGRKEKKIMFIYEKQIE